jgi:hypothetical protein
VGARLDRVLVVAEDFSVGGPQSFY